MAKVTVSPPPRLSPGAPWLPPWFLGWLGCEFGALAHPLSWSLRPPSQDKLSGQGFGTDLPLVDHQVEQHNIFHNEVKAIGPHLAKDGGKVRAVVAWAWAWAPGRRGHACGLPVTRSPALSAGEQRTPGQVPETAGENSAPGEWEGRGWDVGGLGGQEACAVNISNRMKGVCV